MIWKHLLRAVVLAGMAGPEPAHPQTDARLVSALRLAQEGLSDSARTVVTGVMARTAATDSLYPQILYTRALIAAEPAAMRTDLQRVAVEYASSNWADDALLRLVLLEYAGGQLEAAARHLERLELDHSGSPLYGRAAVWAGRVYFELQRPADACRWLRAGQGRAGEDASLRSELEAVGRRCAEVAAAPDAAAGPIPAPRADTAQRADTIPRADTVPRADAAPAPPPPPPPAPAFRIQIAAVTSAAAADSIAARARAAGFEAVVTREAPYYKVRIGAFRTRAEAAAALPGVRTRFRGKPFVAATRE